MRPTRIGAPPSEPIPIPRYSRWKAGITTFGPAIKIIITIVLSGIGFVTWYMSRIVDGAFVIVDMAVYVAAALFILRHVWRRDRVA